MYDVIIVGGGPAGAACALELSRDLTLRVALIDKSEFPRDKVCGDAIPGAAWRSARRLAASLGIPLPPPSPRHDVSHARFFGNGSRALALSWVIPAFNATRVAFDEWLYSAMVDYTLTDCIQSSISSVERKTDRTVVTLPDGRILETKLIIGCDGANSVVARNLTDTRLDRRHHLAAVRAYYRGVEHTQAHTNDFYFLRRWQPGYLWVFPVGDGLYNVGFGMASDAIAKRRINLKNDLAEAIAEHPALKARFAKAYQVGKTVGFGLPVGSRYVQAHGDGFMLCGDAAALIDPLGGHGIDKAVDSGIYAAQVGAAALAAGDVSEAELQPYEDLLERRIRPTLRRNGLVMRIGSRAPWLLDVAVQLGRVDAVKRAMQGLL